MNEKIRQIIKDNNDKSGKMFREKYLKEKESYMYIVGNKRFHRFNFRKSKISNGSNKTEHEIMLDKNIYRIYNSGHKCFVYSKKVKNEI